MELEDDILLVILTTEGIKKVLIEQNTTNAAPQRGRPR